MVAPNHEYWHDGRLWSVEFSKWMESPIYLWVIIWLVMWRSNFHEIVILGTSDYRDNELDM